MPILPVWYDKEASQNTICAVIYAFLTIGFWDIFPLLNVHKTYKAKGMANKFFLQISPGRHNCRRGLWSPSLPGRSFEVSPAKKSLPWMNVLYNFHPLELSW